jgi:predicted CXXCH cytochrome family protein
MPLVVVMATTYGRHAMSIKSKVKTVTGSAAVIWLLAGVVVDPIATAFSPGVGAANLDEGVCEFSLQLQSSAETRRTYLAKVIEATGGDAASTVEAMYGNVKKASYSEGEQNVETVDLWGLGGRKSAPQPGLDQMSLDCLGCHDGSAASTIHTDLRNDPFRRGSRVNSFGSDHPMGMDYSKYTAVRSDYKEIIPRSNKMIFVNGKVGCLTCHNPLNMEKGHLVMSDRNSALCLTCHKK